MASLWISYYRRLAEDADSRSMPMTHEPPISEEVVAISGTSAQSSAFPSAATVMRLHTDTACHILVGANPTATTLKQRIAAGATEYRGITAGQKLAVIAAA